MTTFALILTAWLLLQVPFGVLVGRCIRWGQA